MEELGLEDPMMELDLDKLDPWQLEEEMDAKLIQLESEILTGLTSIGERSGDVIRLLNDATKELMETDDWLDAYSTQLNVSFLWGGDGLEITLMVLCKYVENGTGNPSDRVPDTKSPGSDKKYDRSTRGIGKDIKGH